MQVEIVLRFCINTVSLGPSFVLVKREMTILILCCQCSVSTTSKQAFSCLHGVVSCIKMSRNVIENQNKTNEKKKKKQKF